MPSFTEYNGTGFLVLNEEPTGEFATANESNVKLAADTLTALEDELDAHAADTSTHGVAGSIVGTTDSQSLSNKLISGAYNTITEIGDSALSVGISAEKIADGSVSDTEFQCLGGVTSDIQTQFSDAANDLIEHEESETGVHGATASPTANKLMARDSNGDTTARRIGLGINSTGGLYFQDGDATPTLGHWYGWNLFLGGHLGITERLHVGGYPDKSDRLYVSGTTTITATLTADEMVVDSEFDGCPDIHGKASGTGIRVFAGDTYADSAGFQCYANDHSSFAGQIYFDAGDVATGVIQFRTGAQITRLTIQNDGSFDFGVNNLTAIGSLQTYSGINFDTSGNVYVPGFIAPGSISAYGGNTVPFTAAPALPDVNTGMVSASDYPYGLVWDSNAGHVFFSNASSWLQLS